MKRIFLIITLTGFFASGCGPAWDSASSDEEKLQILLNDFLDGASVNDAAMHDRFWAEDLIYTGSAGNRTTKSEIMDGLEGGSVNAAEEPPVYSAEDVQIRVYGDVAVVAFKLVAEDEYDRMEYYNTGTFLNRENEWRAVAWQATRIP